MKSLFLLSILSIVSSSVTAQNLVLSHTNKSVTIEPNQFLEITLPPDSGNPENCSGKRIIGKYISQKGDSIKIRLKQYDEIDTEDRFGRKYSTITYSDTSKAPMYYIPKQDILSVTRLGKRGRETTAPQVVGGILIVTGAGHLTAAPFLVEDKLDTGIFGLTEILVGGILFGVGERKKFITSEFCPGIRPGTKVWKIE